MIHKSHALSILLGAYGLRKSVYTSRCFPPFQMQGEMKEVSTTNFDDPGPSMSAKSTGLFTPTLLYLGVNRVINDWDEEAVLDRVGSGLCSACVKIVEC